MKRVPVIAQSEHRIGLKSYMGERYKGCKICFGSYPPYVMTAYTMCRTCKDYETLLSVQGEEVVRGKLRVYPPPNAVGIEEYVSRLKGGG